jgi:hypothetical protein
MTSSFLIRKRIERKVEAEMRRHQQELERKLRHEMWLAKVRAKRSA